jgi:hypothetical protein
VAARHSDTLEGDRTLERLFGGLLSEEGGAAKRSVIGTGDGSRVGEVADRRPEPPDSDVS